MRRRGDEEAGCRRIQEERAVHAREAAGGGGRDASKGEEQDLGSNLMRSPCDKLDANLQGADDNLLQRCRLTS
eukprot:192908-Hanusia_phi.AAC.3